MIPWFGFAAGLILLGFTASSVVKTFMIPRATRTRINKVVSVVVYGLFRLLTAKVDDLPRRERMLASSAPAFLLCLLTSWLACLFAGFSLLLWPAAHSFWLALRESGSSLFTLGFALPPGPGSTVIVFVAAASGLAVLALLISYLPLLYTAFNRRETLVAMLEALAGAPPWGPELLARQALIDNSATLPGLYGRWTEWAADISESHVNYRTLVYFRSPDPAVSWLLSLLAVLDGAALHLALNPVTAPYEARPLLRVGYLTMRQLATNLGLTVPDDPRPDDPIELTRAEFDEAVQWLKDAGWRTERTAQEAWPHFHGWRVNYESAAYKLAMHLDLPPALWSGPRRAGRPAAAPPRRPTDRKPAGREPAGPPAA
ncbi:MAG TPA: hypothetical protein VNF47_12505 [Streptosporangiaceae bacterium]|nr:hypothetical protein [Streptosporangiaceae bacterium]